MGVQGWDGMAAIAHAITAQNGNVTADGARAYLHGNCGHCHRPGGWTPPDLDMDLLFTTEPELKWPLAMAKLGVDISMLSGTAGHA